MQTEKVWESQGNYYTKLPIMIGDYINKKDIGVANDVIPKTEYSWIDTDYTVHPSKNHPPIPSAPEDVDEISWILANNRKFSVGKCIDIDRITGENGIHKLSGIYRFNEPKLAKDAVKAGAIPLYNSSSIYELDRDNKTGLTTKFVAIDNCAVDSPAGELELFRTTAHCEGGMECIHQLKQSAIGPCGFCKLEALKSFKFKYPVSNLHDSHNSLNMKQSSSMSTLVTEGSNSQTQPPANQQEQPNTLDTTKEIKNQKEQRQSKPKSKVDKLGKEIKDSGWVSSNEDREQEQDESEQESEKSEEEEAKAKLDYKKLYEEEKSKHQDTNKTVQDLLAESRLNKVSAKFTALPMEIWEGDEKARSKDIDFFNGLYDQKIDEKLLNKLIEKYVSKIPIAEIQAARKTLNLGLKQSGWTPLDEVVTHSLIARTKGNDSESQLSEGDIVLGALED